jgi:ubiquinone/menaquinone biosynthesis C-methylase UbiE
MSAHYDTYDYPSYWEGREYENDSEVIAIKAFLGKIPKIKTILEIGTGFGRLTPSYSFRAKKIILSDPSAKLLKIAREKNAGNPKIEYLQICMEHLPAKIRPHSIDLVIMVRVIHHLGDLNGTLKIVSKLVHKGGYFILEFANKSHVKATFKELFKGNFTFPLDIFSKDINSLKSKRGKTLPFINYHPDTVIQALKNSGFEVLSKRSVSNIRSPRIKKFLPLSTLLSLERILQEPLSYFSFGPSIFILAKKRG